MTGISALSNYLIRSFQPIRGTPYLDIKMDIHLRATDLYRYGYISISIYPDSRVDIDISHPNKQVCWGSNCQASCSKYRFVKTEEGRSKFTMRPALSSRTILILTLGTALQFRRGRLARSDSSADGSLSAAGLPSKTLRVLCLSVVASSCTKIVIDVLAQVISSGCGGARCEEYRLALCIAKMANPVSTQRAVIDIKLNNEQAMTLIQLFRHLEPFRD